MTLKILMLFLVLFTCDSVAAQVFNFDIDIRYHTHFNISGDKGRYKIIYENYDSDKKIKEGVILSDSQKEVNLIHDDYNFDGSQDIAIWHMDEGMATYRVFRIFVFEPILMSFTEVFSSCGDEFINVELDKKNKKIDSAYFSDGELVQCVNDITI